MYDLARSCQELKKKVYFFLLKKRRKSVFSTKDFPGKTKILSRYPKQSEKRQESCQEIRENARNSKNLAKRFKRKTNKSE